MRTIPQLPFPRDTALDIAPLQHAVGAENSISPVRTPAGDRAWLVTDYSVVRSLFTDERLGRSHPDPPNAPIITCAALAGGPIGDDLEEETAAHRRMRALLAPAFTAHRMRTLRRQTDALVNELLTSLLQSGPPADLHRDLAFPLPMRVICGLLGVPIFDADRLQTWSRQLANLDDAEQADRAWLSLVNYMRVLVQEKLRQPREDIITDLVTADIAGGVDELEIAGMCAGVLFAGHETTVARIDFGTLLLLAYPEQKKALMSNAELVDGAVEEILRLVAPVGSGGQTRYAHADIEIHGQTIRCGDAVLLSEISANRDPTIFVHPDEFDIRRAPNQHMTFGYGPRYCIGANLARVELQSVFTVLFRRLPALRLTTPLEQIVLREDLFTGGIAELPITW